MAPVLASKRQLWDWAQVAPQKSKSVKKQVHKWQRTYEREHQSMVWLHAELDDQDKSLVSMLWCIAVRD